MLHWHGVINLLPDLCGVSSMKATFFLLLLLLLGSPIALAQDTTPAVDLDDPGAVEARGDCLSECEAVFSDCESECENSGARAREPHDEGPDLPAGECIDDCNADLKLCSEDC